MRHPKEPKERLLVTISTTTYPGRLGKEGSGRTSGKPFVEMEAVFPAGRRRQIRADNEKRNWGLTGP